MGFHYISIGILIHLGKIKSQPCFFFDIDSYLQGNIRFQLINGSYKTSQKAQCYFSILREKTNACCTKVIIDISWSKDASVNLDINEISYLTTNLLMTFPTVDHTTGMHFCNVLLWV